MITIYQSTKSSRVGICNKVFIHPASKKNVKRSMQSIVETAALCVQNKKMKGVK